MDAPTLQSLTTVAGAAILVAVLMQLFLNAAKLASDVQDRFGPIIAVVLGIVVVEVATFTIVTGASKADIVQGAINGVFAGLASMGIHNVVTKTVAPPS